MHRDPPCRRSYAKGTPRKVSLLRLGPSRPRLPPVRAEEQQQEGHHSVHDDEDPQTRHVPPQVVLGVAEVGQDRLPVRETGLDPGAGQVAHALPLVDHEGLVAVVEPGEVLDPYHVDGRRSNISGEIGKS